MVLGLGDNIDYEIVWDRHVIQDMLTECNLHFKDITQPARINSIRNLLISILYNMNRGTGEERHVDDPDLIHTFTKRFSYKTTLGGTSVRAAITMDKVGLASTVHLVTDNDLVRLLLPSSTNIISRGQDDTVYPHLIIQYPADCTIEVDDISLTTRRANRLIYVNDADNQNMKINENLGPALKDADIFLISGFNAIQEEKILDRALEDVLHASSFLSPHATLFYEDAGFHQERFNEIVCQGIEAKIDIHSMNEDELKNYTGKTFSLLDPQEVYETVQMLYRKLAGPTLMIHSRYWAIAFGERALSYKEALSGGVCMATTRFRKGDDFTKEDYRATSLLHPEVEAIEFCETFNSMYNPHAVCVPSLDVKEKNVTTIGLGDAYVGGFLATLALENQ